MRAASNPAACCALCLRNKDCVAWTMAEHCWLKGVVVPMRGGHNGLVSGLIPNRKPTQRKPPAPWVGTTPQERRRARKQPYACAHDQTELDGERYLISATPALDWSEAYPLGDGSLGSLVGGEPFVGRIPLAEEGLVQTRKFVEGRHAAERAQGDKMRAQRKQQKKETAEDRLWAARPSTPFQAFGEARRALLDSDSVKAHQLSRWLDGGPVAAFEGLATLWYLVDVPTVTMPVLPTPKVTGKNRKPAPPRKPSLSQIFAHNNPKFFERFERSLDVDQGVYHSTFATNTSQHAREGWASRPDRVTVLKFDCSTTCALHFGLDRSTRAVPKLYQAPEADVFVLASPPSVDDVAFAACAVAVGPEPVVLDLQEKPLETYVSRSASDTTVLLIAGVTGNDPENECLDRLVKAASLGYTELRRRRDYDVQQTLLRIDNFICY